MMMALPARWHFARRSHSPRRHDAPARGGSAGREAAFGLWRDRAEDGLAYQARIRAEEWREPFAAKPRVLRRSSRLKLLDAIVWASARAESALLVTRNTKAFPAGDPGVRVPY